MLSKLLCKITGETVKDKKKRTDGSTKQGTRNYEMAHSDFYTNVVADNSILIDFVVKLAEVLNQLQLANLVHSDIRPDNIMIQFSEDQSSIESLKVIDFGSSF